MGHYPNLKPIIKSMCRGDPVSEKALNEYALQCIQPSIKYYKEHLQSNMQSPLAVFKAAQLFCPTKLQEIQPSESTLDELTVIPFVDANVLQHLKNEFPTYCALAGDVDPSYDICKFWQNHAEDLPCLVCSCC